MNTNDTIVALATPPGQSAIAIIRLSGYDCFPIMSKITTVDCQNFKHKKLLLLNLYKDKNNQDSFIDQCVVLPYHAPLSYTGENIIEINTHGSMLIVQLIITALLENGARFARAGEFTERAFLNGKLDLIQSESIDALIRASTELELSLVHNHYNGQFSKSIHSLKSSFIELLSLIELELDFSEEDVEFASRTRLQSLLDETEHQLTNLFNSYKRTHIIRDGFSVAIVGKPNVGKSSFLNLLLKKERAIVSEMAGTTRDVITEEIDISGYKFVFSDTAGIHLTDNPIEKEGILRSSDVIKAADLVFVLLDSSKRLTKEDFELKNQLCVDQLKKSDFPVFLLNKSDKYAQQYEEEYLAFLDNFSYFSISCLNGSGFDLIESFLINTVKARTQYVVKANTTIINERQKNVINEALESVGRAKESFCSGLSQEYIASDIRLAINYLGELIGEVSNEDILSNIFINFCIGK